MVGGRWFRHVFTHTQDGDTALMWAAANGHTDCVRALVGAGVNKDATNKVRNIFLRLERSLHDCVCASGRTFYDVRLCSLCV